MIGSIERARTRWIELRFLGSLLPLVPRIRPGSAWSASRLLDECVRRDPSRVGIAFEDRRFTWRDIDAEVNRTARALQALGIGPGDVVALLMDNRPEYLFAVTALSRLRATGALVNTQITGGALVHAIQVASSRAVLVGAEHASKVEEVIADLEGIGKQDVWVQSDDGTTASDFDDLLADQSDARPAIEGTPRVEEHMCYIYTSGTTGLPKAAIITNKKFLTTGFGFGRLFELESRDVTYMTLPLYHAVGMFIGWASTLTFGCTLAVRRKFSASAFWDDVVRFDATVFIYIGELCRYLLNQPPHRLERAHRLRLAGGNGLRPDIWEAFQERFGIPKIREYYGATEGNAPLLNLEGRVGMVGRVYSDAQAVVRCDLETGEMQRGPDGFAERVSTGETGLLLGRIDRILAFDGYVDPEATRKKVVEDVFEKGDRYFDTGDLLTLHENGWLGFADRVGDTYRWKGENVSTNEVAEILNGAPGVLETNVYGVELPGREGRAGMASVNCGDDFSLSSFAAYAREHLASYQRPYFLRLQKDMRITGTFKHQKVDYRREGYDPGRVSDPLYLLRGDDYVPLDESTYEDIRAGRIELP